MVAENLANVKKHVRPPLRHMLIVVISISNQTEIHRFSVDGQNEGFSKMWVHDIERTRINMFLCRNTR